MLTKTAPSSTGSPDRKGLCVVHLCEAVRGGVATYLLDLLDHQRQQKDISRLVVVGDPQRITPELRAAAPEFVPYPTTRRPWALPRTLSALWKILRDLNPDIVHLHSTFPGVYGRLPGRWDRGHAKIVYCPHGWSFSQPLPTSARLAYEVTENLLARRSDAIIAISQHEARQARRIGIRDSIIHCLPTTLRDCPPAPRRDFGLKSGILAIGFLGRFDPQKGYDVFCTATSHVRRPDMAFLAFGGYDRERDKIHAPPGPHIQESGWVPQTEVDSYLAGMDALVMPSQIEGFGLVAVEALRNGTPVIASRRGGLPELIEDGVSGFLFDPAHPDQLTRLLQNLDGNRLHAMRAAARARFEHLCLHRDHRAETFDIYRSLVAE